MLGQDQDKFGGSFEADQSFSGKLADLRMMERVLESTELAEMDLCNLGNDGWTFLESWNISNIVVTEEDQEELCHENFLRDYFISIKPQDFYQSRETCDLINGKLPVPETEREFDDMVEVFWNLLNASNYEKDLGFMLGFTFNLEEDTWHNVYTNTAVPETHFMNQHKREGKNCFIKWIKDSENYPISCNKRDAGTICKIEDSFQLHLKGLCSEVEKARQLLFDEWFYVYGLQNEKPHFQ